MFIKQLELSNFGPFLGTNVLNFNENDKVIFVSAEYEDNKQQSNNAGKSMLVEAIVYCLFGFTRGKLKEIDLIHKGQKEMHVKAIITIDGRDITVKRGRTSDNKAILDIEGLKGKKTTKEKEFQELLNIDLDSFLLSYYFPQDEIHGFMASGPLDRKKLIQKWLKLDRWGGYEEASKAEQAKHKDSMASLESSITSHSLQITGYSNKLIDESSIKTEIDYRMASLQESNSRMLDVKIQLSNIADPSAINQTISSICKEISTLDTNFKKYDNEYNELTSRRNVSERSEKELEQLKGTLTESSEALSKKLDESKDILKDIHTSIDQIKRDTTREQESLKPFLCFSGICPVDKKPCDKGTRIPDEKARIEELIRQLDKQNKELQEAFTLKYKISKDIEARRTEALNLESKIDRLKCQAAVKPVYETRMSEVLDNINNIQASRKVLETKLSEAGKALEGINVEKKKELADLLNKENSLQSLTQARLRELHLELGAQAQLRQNIQDATGKMNDQKAKLEEAKKQYYQWTYISHMFGKDIPTILVENSLSEIEDVANVILDHLSSKLQIEFTTQREVTTKETHCSICGAILSEAVCKSCGYGVRKNKIKDEIDLKISNGFGDYSFSQNSGGGKVLISLAVRLALTRLLSNNSRKCELLILDEVFGALDAVNRDLVSKVVFNTVSNLLGFRQLFVITHCDLNNFNYKHIKILRKNGYSVLTSNG